MNIFNAEILWARLAMISMLLLLVLGLINKNMLHLWLAKIFAYFFLFFATTARTAFDIKNKLLLVVPGLITIAFIALIIWEVKKAQKIIDKRDLSLKSFSVVLLFLLSYLIGIRPDYYGLPRFVGYLLVAISFLIGLFVALYRKRSNKTN